MNSKSKLVFIFILTLVLFLGFSFQGFADYYDGEINKIADRETEIDERVKNLEKSILDIQNNKGNIELEISILEKELKRLSKMIVETEKRVEEKEKVLNRVREDLLKTYDEIIILEAELLEREDSFRKRVQSLHKGNQISFVDVVISSESFGDMVSRLFSFKVIVNEDNRVIEEYIALSEKLDKKKVESEYLVKELENHLTDLEIIKLDLDKGKKKTEYIKKDKKLKSKDLAVQLRTMLDERTSLIKEKENLKIEKNNLSLEKKKFLEEEQNKSQDIYSFEDLSGIEYFDKNVEEEKKTGKIFITPTKGKFSSPFGPRWGSEQRGIDIANSIGTPIIASAGGIVTMAEPFDTYGNVIMIEHNIKNKTYMTVYAHLDSFGVRKGDVVDQGQIIALMGSTGRSTGPHLHFEIYENGVWENTYKKLINPIKFLK